MVHDGTQSKELVIGRSFIHTCEFIGSMFLVIAAVSPMILFLEVFESSLALALLADALAVGFVLFALIEIFGPICTAYFNPVVSFSFALTKDLSWSEAARYSFFQILGGLTGIILTHLMYYDRISVLIDYSVIERSGGAYAGEFLGTFLLVLCILSLVHQRSNRISLVVGLLVGGMILATSSTMFANPMITIARIFTYANAGIHIADAFVFIILQFIAGFVAVLTWKHVIARCVCRV